MHQNIPVFLAIKLSEVDWRWRKSPWAVQIKAAPKPRMTEEMYMNIGVGFRNIQMYIK